VIGQNREINYREFIEKKYGSADKVIIFDYVDDAALVIFITGHWDLYICHCMKDLVFRYWKQCNADTPVICSNAASIPEVAGNAAIMIEPNDNSKRS
jgi:hypothetical protein